MFQVRHIWNHNFGEIDKDFILDFPVHVVQPDELRSLLRQVAAKPLQIAGEEQ